jgi:formiminotetrahydrofolate cyclodeaminase
MNYQEVIEKILDSKDVTIGGGSASCISGAMAAGLSGMVARLSVGKDYGLTDEQYVKIADELDELGKKLESGSVADADAYMQIINAYKLPKATDEEKEARKAAIQAAVVAAATQPMDNAKLCLDLHKLCVSLKGVSNTNAESDLLIGIGLSALGIRGCVMNIKANLGIIKDESKVAFFNEQIKYFENYLTEVEGK